MIKNEALKPFAKLDDVRKRIMASLAAIGKQWTRAKKRMMDFWAELKTVVVELDRLDGVIETAERDVSTMRTRKAADTEEQIDAASITVAKVESGKATIAEYHEAGKTVAQIKADAATAAMAALENEIKAVRAIKADRERLKLRELDLRFKIARNIDDAAKTYYRNFETIRQDLKNAGCHEFPGVGRAYQEREKQRGVVNAIDGGIGDAVVIEIPVADIDDIFIDPRISPRHFSDIKDLVDTIKNEYETGMVRFTYYPSPGSGGVGIVAWAVRDGAAVMGQSNDG